LWQESHNIGYVRARPADRDDGVLGEVARERAPGVRLRRELDEVFVASGVEQPDLRQDDAVSVLVDMQIEVERRNERLPRLGVSGKLR
jgi:hypothetical protein